MKARSQLDLTADKDMESSAESAVKKLGTAAQELFEKKGKSRGPPD
jgi:hypothetical protein